MGLGDLALVFGAALTGGCLAMPIVRGLAITLGAVDRPGKRRLHLEITPRLGGLAVSLGVLAGLGSASLLGAGHSGSTIWPVLVPIVLASIAVAGIGVLDDIRGAGAPVKLIFEIAVSAAIWKAGLRIDEVSVPGVGAYLLGSTVSLAATVLWLVAVTNAFNLIDGVNGLAGGVAGITAAGLLVLARLAEVPVVSLLSASLIGAVLAFLFWNLRRGGIFLGDSGSLFLGFLLGAATIALGREAGGVFFPGTALLLMGLPLVEVATTVVRRALASRSLRRLGPAGVVRFLRRELMRPDAGHLHHCLIRRGLRAGTSSAFLVGTDLVYCLASVSFYANPRAEVPAWGIALAATALCLGICRPLARIERAEPRSSPAIPALRVIEGGRIQMREVSERERLAV